MTTSDLRARIARLTALINGFDAELVSSALGPTWPNCQAYRESIGQTVQALKAAKESLRAFRSPPAAEDSSRRSAATLLRLKAIEDAISAECQGQPALGLGEGDGHFYGKGLRQAVAGMRDATRALRMAKNS